MIEAVGVWLDTNVWWIICLSAGIIFFWQFRKWNVAKFIEKQKTQKYEMKVKPSQLDQDLQQYINNPEEAIRVLMADRAIKEKEHNTAGIESIDQQIKMLQYLIKIPRPLRPFASSIGKVAIDKIENIVKGL